MPALRHPCLPLPWIALASALLFFSTFAHADQAVEVINAGKGGNNTRHLLARVDAVLAESKPDLVVLMVGTNDALNSKAMVPDEEYRNNLLALIEKFRTAGAQPVLMTILPCHAPYLIARHGEQAFADASPDERIATVNAAIREIATTEDVPLIELNRIFNAIGDPGEGEASLLRNQLNSNSADGVHPTRNGYRVIATAVYQEIQALEKTPEHVLCFGDSITYGAGMQGAGSAEGDTYPGMLARLLSTSK